MFLFLFFCAFPRASLLVPDKNEFKFQTFGRMVLEPVNRQPGQALKKYTKGGSVRCAVRFMPTVTGF